MFNFSKYHTKTQKLSETTKSFYTGWKGVTNPYNCKVFSKTALFKS